MAVASATAGFGGERTDVFATIEDYKRHKTEGPLWRKAGHQRFETVTSYSLDDRVRLLRWYIERCNRLMYELADVANFTETPDTPVDPIFAFEHYLTVDRLMRKTLLSISLEEHGSATFLAFEVAELYDTLSLRFKNHKQSTDFFKRLFDTSQGPAMLGHRLALLPEPYQDDLPLLVEALYKTIEEKIIGSIWVKEKIRPDGIVVRDEDLGSETPMPRPEFVGNLMRVFRNAHHGYFTAGDRGRRSSRYLYMVDGNLPVEVAALPALWWLAYLADPTLVGWNHLPVNAYQ
jgi:hypothetical protein